MPKPQPKKQPILVPLLYRGERLLGTAPSESAANTMAANLNRGRSGSDLITWKMGLLEEAELQLKAQRAAVSSVDSPGIGSGTHTADRK